MIYLEPAPYITGFVEHVRKVWRERVDVAYVAMAQSQPWEHKLAPEGEFLLPEGRAAAIKRIAALIAQGRYRLVHLAGWGHPVLLAALLIARWRRIPVAVETDTQRPAQNGGWKSAVKRLVYPWLFSLPQMFLPGGSRQAAYLRDYGVGDDRIRVAQMTVDVEGIRARIEGRRAEWRARFRKRLGIPADAVCALFVARLEPHKGVDDLIAAYRAVVAARSGVFLAVVGAGSLRTAVEAAASEPGGMRYAGRLAGDDLLAAYCAADIFVVPSRDEPWGLVVNEAMAAGLPVIATDRVGCIDDIVREGVTGLIVPASSPERMAAAIVRLMDDPGLRAALGQRGGELISGWTLRNQAGRTAAGWEHILA